MTEQISLKERIISALSYISAGWIGLIYMIYLHFKKVNSSRFLRYNVFQSIFLSLAIFIIYEAFKILTNILLVIPLIKTLVSVLMLIFFGPILIHYSLFQLAMTIFFGYLTIMAFLGRYPKVYWVSNNIIVKASR